MSFFRFLLLHIFTSRQNLIAFKKFHTLNGSEITYKGSEILWGDKKALQTTTTNKQTPWTIRITRQNLKDPRANSNNIPINVDLIISGF